MNVLKALLLTLAPPILGLASFYRTIYPYSTEDLVVIIGMQLAFVNFRWVAISLLLNLWLVWKLESRPKS